MGARAPHAWQNSAPLALLGTDCNPRTVGMERDYEAEVSALRARVAQLEGAMSTRTDPILVSLLQNHASFLFVVNPDGRMVATGRISDAYGSVVGRSMFEFMSPAAALTAKAALKRACDSKLPVDYEADGYGEDGGLDHVYHVRAVPMATDGSVEAIVIVPTDITERVRLERSLRETNDSLRLAVTATGMGFWRFDVQTNSVAWDARMLELFGIEGAPPDYATYLNLIHADDVPLIESAVRSALEQGVYPTVEHRIRPANGGPERWILGAATVEKDPAGSPLVIRGGALDITDRKNLSRQLERAERVQAVGQLAAGIAHNFNNLLAIILPGLAMAVEGPSTRDEEGLEAALTAALRARDLVRSMFSLTTTQPAGHSENADLGEIVRRTVSMCRATFPRQIEWRVDIDEERYLVPLSPSDLEHLVLNLLTNARDAVELLSSTQGRIDIRVQAVPADTPSGGTPPSVRGVTIGTLIIADNGPGMTAETRGRIFEPFFTTKSPDRGTGLGLTTVAARVRGANGSIECTSSPGQGTSFTVVLPLCREPTGVRVGREGLKRGSLSGRVLIVDDEPMVRSTMRRLLELVGLEVREASSAQAARAVLEGVSVDLIILDDSMPEESGLQALGSLQARSKAPVMLFTGYAPEVPDGIAAFVRKPAHPDEIFRTVQSLMKQPSVPAA
jgi:signal transduction histidine kinase